MDKHDLLLDWGWLGSDCCHPSGVQKTEVAFQR
jgi:hypothetical protein